MDVDLFKMDAALDQKLDFEKTSRKVLGRLHQSRKRPFDDQSDRKQNVSAVHTTKRLLKGEPRKKVPKDVVDSKLQSGERKAYPAASEHTRKTQEIQLLTRYVDNPNA